MGTSIAVGAAGAVFANVQAPDGRGGRPIAASSPVPPFESPFELPPATPSPTPKATPTRGKKKPKCTVSAILEPTCGAWWGVAPVGTPNLPHDRSLRLWEEKAGRTAGIFHAYHRGEQIFPTSMEMKIARQPGKERLLLLNWKPLKGTWAQVARGSADAHIDKLSRHIKRNFPERFFLTIHHEPEDEVNLNAGSGYTPDDYRAMFRHVIKRFRANGVGNIVSVVTFMGWPGEGSKPWFARLYPGDDVVDWIAYDPYAQKSGDDNFAQMVNRTAGWAPRWPGFYRWAERRNKPLMLSEWGVGDRIGPAGRKQRIFKQILPVLKQHPRIKALVYFDTPVAPHFGDTSIGSSPAALAAFRAAGRDPYLNPKVP
ncbi:hypothetical protein DPM19_15260 [Actinomadura craniellae]|uniref:GH26 domain-containing protein n=1 Tax=Actinomadura craniellae TaxID=2231787 RepID=A0A365H5F0_9ACTN|nr:hypothetical protein [Actinomadura craniellae]RAY14327.1 hypothetical protein DPM19_15260 [Actinomadura craniellae]